MKAPLSWLKEYVDLDEVSPAELAGKLTFAGIEVEAIATVGSDYAGLVVGEVREVLKHPNADRLRLCKVFDGTDTVSVVCGATNFAAGDKAAFAPAGTVLPDGTKLRKAKIRGEVSMGMLCAGDELGLSDDHSGILLFDREVPAGTPLAEMLPGPDTVFELEITWNRSDWLSLIGLARECAALLGRELRRPSVALPEETGDPIETRVDVAVEDGESCPRYTARLLTDVNGRAASPDWMRRRLALCGMRPINAVVDITNYVMLECGQPLHAFDLAKLSGGALRVRRAAAGETIATLDGGRHELDPDVLVIADRDAPVAVAGVMGGADSEIDDATRAVVLESAVFDPARVKLGADRLSVRTESSHRFERGVDPGMTGWGSARAAALIASICGAKVAPGMWDIDRRPAAPEPVRLRHRRAAEVIGLELEPARMEAVLISLGLEKVSGNDRHSDWRPPSWRGDLEAEADLIEEIARLHGLESLPEGRPSAPYVSDLDESGVENEARCRDVLLGLGFNEAANYSFLASDRLNDASPGDPARRIRLPNPVSADHDALRDALLPQLIETLGRNHSRQVSRLCMFEIGRVFFKDEAGRPAEEPRLALGLFGPVGRAALDRRRPVARDEALLWLKGALERLAEALHAPAPELSAAAAPGFLPGWSARIRMDGEPVGWIGLVNDALRHRWRMTAPMAVAEVRLDRWLAAAGAPPAPGPLPPFPAVTRDLALVVPPGISHARIVESIRRNAPEELTRIELFDRFELSEKKGKSRKRSMAYSLEYRSDRRTLTDEEVNGFHGKVMDAIRNDLEVEIRER